MNLFTPLFTAKGGVSPNDKIPRRDDRLLPLPNGRRRTLGEEAIARMGGDTSKVGVLLLAFDEASQILKAGQPVRDTLQPDVVRGRWHGASQQTYSADAPLEANHLKLFSLLPQSAQLHEVHRSRGEVRGGDGR